jgi:hypothetical protein
MGEALVLETLTVLIAAHIVIELAIRPPFGASTWAILLRALCCGLVAGAITGSLDPRLISGLLAPQLISDAVRQRLRRVEPAVVSVDQALKLAATLGLWLAFPNAFAEGFWGGLSPDAGHGLLIGETLLAGAIANLQGGAKLTPLLTDRFVRQLRGAVPGLNNGGLWIGWLERALVMMLVLSNQITAVGFLVTAKSILRFGEIKDARQRRLAEYIIIGTFLSFSWALLVSLITAKALAVWM